MRSFKNLEIWNDAIQLTAEAYAFCKILPLEEKYNLISQIQRASVSVPTNISEGCSRSSQRDFKRFLEISLGSCFELENLLILSTRLYPNNNAKTDKLQEATILLQKRIKTLMNKLS